VTRQRFAKRILSLREEEEERTMSAMSRVGWAILLTATGMLGLWRTASGTTLEAHGAVGFPNGIGGTSTTLDSYSAVLGGVARFDNTAVVDTDQSIHLMADSFASGPGQHAHTFAGWNHLIGNPTDPDGFRTFLAQSGVHAAFTDMVITPPGGVTGPVLTSINFHIDGSLSVGSFFTPSLVSIAESQVELLLLGPTSLTSRNIGAGSLDLRSENGMPATGFGIGVLASLATAPSIASLGSVGFSVVFSSSAFLAPVGVPFTVELDLDTNAFVTNELGESFRTFANTDFAGTLSFATDRPVFNLPPGFTANSVDAQITDNTFSSASPTPTPSPSVPEAGSLMLLASGCVLLALSRCGLDRTTKTRWLRPGHVNPDDRRDDMLSFLREVDVGPQP